MNSLAKDRAKALLGARRRTGEPERGRVSVPGDMRRRQEDVARSS